ncbi:MAG: phosphoribosylglycinamide formyltransferase [Bacteroidales bacterium]|nr:phosphoribosylglycinamide formyltransferase [Bacteroidales bacterium]
MINIAIFASGNGTNTEQIIRYFREHNEIHVNFVLSNKPRAYVLERARRLGVDTFVFDRRQFYYTNEVINALAGHTIDFIVLAGFLWLIPGELIKAYKNRMLNIHPALLPKYGGKGMYGKKVHEAVKNSGDTETGISIHYVNEKYDEGQVIFQARCPVQPDDTPDDIAAKVHQLEYEYYPKVIEREVKKIKDRH